jgi:hypothetical protein
MFIFTKLKIEKEKENLKNLTNRGFSSFYCALSSHTTLAKLKTWATIPLNKMPQLN